MSWHLLIAAGKPRLPEWLRVIQENFGNDNSVPRLLTTVAVLAAIPALAAVSYNFLQKRRTAAEVSRPRTLFRRVLRKLPLGRGQRAIARRMARDLHLPNPTILVLSAELFDRHAARWMGSMSSKRRKVLESSAFSGLPAALFGSGYQAHQGSPADSDSQPDS